MRKWAVVLLLAISAWPAMAAKSVTVGQLEQLLDTLRGKSDGKVAQELSDLELTERVSPARLAHWEKDFPGGKTHEALIKLADLAAFLNPPAGDVVPIPGPDSGTQERMLGLAAEYVKTAITRLPNFIATRETTHFEDMPSMQTGVAAAPLMVGRTARSMSTVGRTLGPSMNSTEYKSLQSTGSYSAAVMYRDGNEVHETDTEQGKNQFKPVKGLTTNGEFGPILSVVMGDALRSEVTWQRWEQGTSEPVAVFRYVVPEEQSNYLVGVPAGDKVEQVYPGYHGEIAVDPATSAILRISVVAELPSPYQAMQVAMLVEYAPVVIGEQSYICPVRGVAFSKVPVAHDAAVQVGSAVNVQTQLNDVAFRQYHLFRSKARIVTGKGGQDDAPAGSPPAAPPQAPSAPTGATPSPQP
ncbi:MAG TPA: hypothetical protein VJX73_04440 [Terracidiphilus sp.]|nr:hypothetical protein [Terracidiphilus sp.]